MFIRFTPRVQQTNYEIYSKAPSVGSTLNNTLPNALHMLSSTLAFNFLPFIQFIFSVTVENVAQYLSAHLCAASFTFNAANQLYPKPISSVTLTLPLDGGALVATLALALRGVSC